MKCNQCGNEFEGKFCPECGAKVPEQTTVPQMPAQQVYQQTATVANPKSKKKKKPFYSRWWFILLAIIILFIGILVLSPEGEKIKWDEMVLGDMLPEPPADRGEIYDNSKEGIDINLNEVSSKEYADYITVCENSGFKVDVKEENDSFEAFNEDGYKLILYYSDYSEELSIDLKAPIEMSKLKWPTSKAGKKIPAPKSDKGNFLYEYEDNFFVYVGDTSKSDYEDYIEACIDAGFDVDYDKGDNHYYADDADGWHISLNYEGFNIMSVDIDAPDEDEGEEIDEETEKNSSDDTEKDTTDEPEDENDNDLDPEFKAAMDSYETFMNEYVEFMKKYNNNPDDIRLIGDYAEYMSKYSDFVEDYEKWEDEEMNSAETAYYIDVQARVSKKLLEIAE